MENYDDDKDFDNEQVQAIASAAVESVVKGKGQEEVVYQPDKVNHWCQQIIDCCIKDLAKLGKEFKYAVTCIILQNNGTGLQTAATAYWDIKSDGLISVQYGNQTFFCIVTIYAMAI